MTTLVVPWSGADSSPSRKRAFERVYTHLLTFGEPVLVPPVIAADGPAQAISRARNRGASQVADDDVIVFNDADSLVEGFQILRAASLARQEPGLVFAYTRYRRLTKESTTLLIIDGRKNDHVRDDWRMEGSVSSGCVAISKASFDQLGGYDETWLDGYEDADLAIRSHEMFGEPRRVPGDLLHLWHERPAVEPEAGRDRERWITRASA